MYIVGYRNRNMLMATSEPSQKLVRYAKGERQRM